MSPGKRRTPWNRNTVEFIGKVRLLKENGYSSCQIAEHENCEDGYIQSVFCLLKHGCPLLLAEVEQGHIPHTIAMQIARAKNPEIQRILVEGYKARTVNVVQIVAIRQRLEEYERENSTCGRRGSGADSVIRHFSKEMAKQRQLIHEAKLAKSRLVFITEAFKRLLADGHFVALLHLEGIHSIPKWLVGRIKELSNAESA
jgi:ParB family chromosome partitioning protein